MRGLVTEGRDADGVPLQDGRLSLRDGRTLAWRSYGETSARPVLRLQGSVSSRLSRGPDPRAAGVRLVVADRPGFGESTRHPGRGLASVADDLVELLDALEMERVPVVAHSAGGPHGLALGACHGDRVEALAVVGGAARVNPEERRGLVGVNAGLGEVLGRGWEAMHGYLAPLADRMLEGGTAAVVADAPDSDRDALMAGVERDRANRDEALRQGVAGWVDETLAITGPWDFDPSQISCPVDWWHGLDDTTVPLTAVRRLAGRIPSCCLHVVADRGHLLGLSLSDVLRPGTGTNAAGAAASPRTGEHSQVLSTAEAHPESTDGHTLSIGLGHA